MLKKLSPTYIIICLYYLLSGVEYAVILPTLNQYLLSLKAEKFFIGLVMASFSLTGLLSAPIYGRVTDITGSTKAAVIFSNLFEIGGNFMYFVASNPYMIIGSRLIAGLGSGSGSSIMGMISRTTAEEERTAAFSQLLSLRQMGLIIGPAFNLFLRKLNFHIGPLLVDAYRAPGLFMALLWTIHELLMIFVYKEFYTKREADYEKEEDECFVDSVDQDSDSEGQSGHVHAVQRPRDRAPSAFITYVYNDLLREEVVVCLAITFTVMFVQTGIETLLTPLSLQLFNWGELPNSLFFLVAGVLVVASFVLLAKLSKTVSDRLMLLVGCSVMTGLYILFLVFIIFAVNAPVGTTWVFVVFVIHSVILVFDLPFVWVPQASLYSKLTSEKTQGFNQGIRLLIMGLGQILGPLWAASLLDRLPIMASVNLFLVAMLTLMIFASYKRLEVAPSHPTTGGDVKNKNLSTNGHTIPSERTPLLSNGSIRSINA